MERWRGAEAQRVARAPQILVVTIAALLIPVAPTAAQEEAIRAAMEATLSAWNQGDFEALEVQYAADARGFFLDGGLLIRGLNRPVLQAAYAAGFRSTMEARDIDVRVFGTVAIAVAFLDGSLQLPDGTVQEGTWRYSETRWNEGERWIVVQYHFSPMTVAAQR